MENFCVVTIPPLFYSFLILFYFTFFLISYFSPLLFSAYISNFSFYHSYFQEFKEFHDMNYKESKGERIIWVEFYIFLFLYSNLILSYIMVYFTDPGEIPDDPIWTINIPDNLPSQVQFEIFAMKLVKREETLELNKNCLTEGYLNLNESNSTTSKCHPCLIFRFGLQCFEYLLKQKQCVLGEHVFR